jgi:TonB family protein
MYRRNILIFASLLFSLHISAETQDITKLPYYEGLDWSMWIPMVKKQAQYPSKARKKNIEGCVNIYFEITSKGKIDTAKVVKSIPTGMFDKYALRALPVWRFDPSKENVERKPILTNTIYTFTLEKNSNGKSKEKWIEDCEQI